MNKIQTSAFARILRAAGKANLRKGDIQDAFLCMMAHTEGLTSTRGYYPTVDACAAAQRQLEASW